VPNYWRRPLVSREAPRQLTAFRDPAPQFAGVTSQLVTYRRKDGVELSATVYLPPATTGARRRAAVLPVGLPAGVRLGGRGVAGRRLAAPLHAAAGRVAPLPAHAGLRRDGQPDHADRRQDGKEPNDTYVEQLVTSAEAAVDKLVAMGVGDRDRMAVGGHSYGAFMTANLLSHTNIFRAGVARSGAYNRTLTPFGFQGEERDYWKAQGLYTGCRRSPTPTG
jgi:dipeptidyl aminopeptidase/acylaminoacyl peptidase